MYASVVLPLAQGACFARSVKACSDVQVIYEAYSLAVASSRSLKPTSTISEVFPLTLPSFDAKCQPRSNHRVQRMGLRGSYLNKHPIKISIAHQVVKRVSSGRYECGKINKLNDTASKAIGTAGGNITALH